MENCSRVGWQLVAGTPVLSTLGFIAEATLLSGAGPTGQQGDDPRRQPPKQPAWD
jgi:hypothetical protein